LKAGEWFMCKRCATSCATTNRRTSGGARIRRQLKRMLPVEEQLPQRLTGSPILTERMVTPASTAISAVSALRRLRARLFSQRSTALGKVSIGPPTISAALSSVTPRRRSGSCTMVQKRPSTGTADPGRNG
jgi:hypothetical protein